MGQTPKSQQAAAAETHSAVVFFLGDRAYKVKKPVDLGFLDRLRHGDVLADVAFLAMDLERLGHPELAARFLAAYREHADDTWPASLARRLPGSPEDALDVQGLRGEIQGDLEGQ